MTDEDNELLAAIQEFRQNLPGWWFSLGDCSVSRDASCGPDRAGPDAHLLTDREFDNGFHADLRGNATMADALRHVMHQALEAKARNAKPSTARAPQSLWEELFGFKL